MNQNISEIVTFVPLTDITSGRDRQRAGFDKDKMEALKKSIVAYGLLHPLVVRRMPEDYSLPLKQKYVLVAGGRRQSALISLWFLEPERELRFGKASIPSHCAPVVVLDDVSELVAKEIELEENIQRLDLTWAEECQAVESLHELRKEQDPAWNLSRTAEEINKQTGAAETSGTVYNKLLVAKNLDKAKGATTEKEAFRKVCQEIEREFQEELGKRFNTKKGKSKKFDLRVGDAIQQMKWIESGTFDVVLTDPPYGIDAQSFATSPFMAHSYNDSWKVVEELLKSAFVEMFRVTKEKAHIYIFCDLVHFFSLSNYATAAGFDVWTRPIIWCKTSGGLPDANMGPSRSYECILFANKGARPVTRLYPDVVVVESLHHSKRIHKAQKPVGVYTNLLRRSVYPGQTILDPFCGSGTVFLACKEVNCDAVGIEQDVATAQACRERLEREL